MNKAPDLGFMARQKAYESLVARGILIGGKWGHSHVNCRSHRKLTQKFSRSGKLTQRIGQIILLSLNRMR